ncbi:MAG TPA: DNA-3-methyladenine glycosylase 2 family protein [Bacteroidia bacterium]|nr:DNA-3-methyladenine glycosylase 2 family protein [Bacteroidia bacterium]
MNRIQVIKHLKKDRILGKVIDQYDFPDLQRSENIYLDLLRSIVGQQLSVKAANTIWQRFISIYPNADPQPVRILKTKTEKLRAVGLSYQKAGYIRNIALFSQENSLEYHALSIMTDRDLVAYLTSIKGVGHWTAEMILMFSLNRLDVFPMNDQGIQNGMRALYQLSEDKKTYLKQMDKIAEDWRPYRSIACHYIWKFKDKA